MILVTAIVPMATCKPIKNSKVHDPFSGYSIIATGSSIYRHKADKVRSSLSILWAGREDVMASAGASGKSTVTPSANRLLQRKWDERKYREHQDRVRRKKL